MSGLTPIFWQNTLPIMVTILVAVFGASLAGWFSNKHLARALDRLQQDLQHGLDGVDRRLDRTEHTVERITRA